jgi:flagellar motor switch protein FliM
MADAETERGAAAPWLREAKADVTDLSIEKMPLLDDALEHFANSAGASLEGLFGVGVSATIDGIEETTTYELLGAYQDHLAAVLNCASLDARLLLILDPEVVDFVVRSIFDAGPAREDSLAEDGAAKRPRSDLESCLIGEFAKLLTTTLRDALAPSTALDIAFESLEELSDPRILGPRDTQAIGAKVTITTSVGACVVIVALPQALLGPISQKLAKGAAPETMTSDPKWTRQMQFGVTQARIGLTAILDEFEMTLGEVSRLAVGQVLDLSGDGRGQIRIECEERGVFHCKLGEQNDRYALEIEDIIIREPDAALNSASAP